MSPVLLTTIYILIMLAAGWWLARRRSVVDFLIAGRENSALVMAAGMIISWVDVGWFLFYGGLGFTMGWAAVIIPIGTITALLLLRNCGAAINEFGRAHGVFTFPGWLAHHYGRKVGMGAALGSVIMFTGWLCFVFVSSSTVISSVFDLSYEYVLIGSLIVVVILVLKGGYGGLTRFDVLQAAVFIVFALGAFTLGVQDGWTDRLADALPYFSATPLVILSIFMTFVSAVFCGGDIWQRIYAARDTGHLRKGMIYASLMAAVAFAIPVCAGIAARGNGYAGPEDGAFLDFFDRLLNGTGQSLFLVIFLAAMLSTINAVSFGAASSLAKDFIGEADSDRLKRRVQIAALAVLVLSAGAAFLYKDIMFLGMMVLNIMSIFLPVTAFSLFGRWKPSSTAAFASILSGGVFYAAAQIFGLWPEHIALTTPAVSLAALLGAHMVSGNKMEGQTTTR